MNPLLVGACFGAVVAFGVLILWRGLHPVKPSLVELIGASSKPLRAAPVGLWPQTLALAARTGDVDSLSADLAVLGRTAAQFAAARVQLCLSLAIIPVVVSAALSTLTGGALNVPVTLIGVLGGAAVGVALSRATLASEAAGRRRRFCEELAAYLDLVAQLVGGGAGIDEALWRAARSTNTPGLVMVRDTIASARVRRRSEWAELGDLATRARLPELAELVTAIELASSDGARVRASLQAKAKSLRAASASEQLAAANRASEYMGGPLIAMLLAFLAVVLAPALAQVLAIN
jgi:tight adherence protein C